MGADNRGEFLSRLRVEDVDGKRWVLLEPLIYVQHGVRYTAPAGFSTDLASIPRLVFWRAKSGAYNEAAVIHDAAYAGALLIEPGGTLTRAEADALFRDAMDTLGVGWWSRTVMYLAVRAGGRRRWRGNAEGL